ncbi:MAG: ABC-2 family transporter protein [Ardenticatenia bacterium]|nr:ABC-2 family transporter protein [Ardenticatenia bacterium]
MMTTLRRIRVELSFLAALWKTNLLAALEYRASFISQVLGMLLNNAAFLAFWLLFFQRFPKVNGWGMRDMLGLYGMTATGFGLGVVLFGNALSLADIISQNGLDPYLSLPRPVLLHVLASGSRISGWGDILTGLLCMALLGPPDAAAWLRYGAAALVSMIVFISFLVLVASLTFWIGSASALSGSAINAILAFATYPMSIFDGSAKLILLTVIPAGFIGALPADFVRHYTGRGLAQLAAAALVFLALALIAFHRGLRHYESGGLATGMGG